MNLNSSQISDARTDGSRTDVPGRVDLALLGGAHVDQFNTGARAGAWAGHGLITVSGAGWVYRIMPPWVTLPAPPRVHPPVPAMAARRRVRDDGHGRTVLWALNGSQTELKSTLKSI